MCLCCHSLYFQFFDVLLWYNNKDLILLQMNLRRLYIIFIALICVVFSAYSLNLPKKTIGNSEFYCYTVQAKETIFGISKKLNISQDDLKKYNPSIANGLKKDFVLLIPVNLIDNKKENSNNVATESKTFTHVVEKGQTLYGLSKTYNVSQEAIIALNPTANGGLKKGQILTIPQPETVKDTDTLSTKKDNDTNIVYHTIEKGETLYSLSKKYNTGIDKILILNPGVSPTNFKINEVIKIAPNTVESEMVETTVTTMVPYVAQKGDNYKKIAKREGVDVDDLKAANPNTDKVKPGVMIQLPKEQKDSVLVAISEGSELELKNNDSERIKEIYDSVHNNVIPDVNIALLLPYMLNDSTPSKSALLYTEFYKGFLLAVKDINSECNNKINIHTYDTENKSDVLNQILLNPEMKDMNLIFAPDGVEPLNVISQFCQDNKIYMVNTFSVKNSSYENNPYIFQINIPQADMQADICEWFDTEFSDYEIMFVHKKGTKEKDLIAELKSHFEQQNKVVHFFEYQSVLKRDEIEKKMEPEKKYVLIPTSGSKTVMSQLLPAVKKINEERLDIDVSIFGAPEWVTYMEDWKNDFHTTDTYFYSRFFVNPQDDNVELFEDEYKHWYGEPLMSAAPQFGYLGYDTGMFFLKSICLNGKDFNNTIEDYKGLQSSFKFERINNWSGFINKYLYFVHFTPDGKIEIIVK